MANQITTIIDGNLTTLRSSVEGMISVRMQDHLWMTNDNAIHVMITETTKSPSLFLYSSFDQGLTWHKSLWLSNSGKRSTADGVLINDRLIVTYSSDDRSIELAFLKYTSSTKTWLIEDTTEVIKQNGFIFSIPTLVIGDNNGIWINYSKLDQLTGKTSLEILYSDNLGQDWLDTNFNFVPPRSSPRTSGSLLKVGELIGTVYADDHTLNWAYRQQQSSLTEPWKVQQILQYQNPSPNDKRGAHFSVVVDELNNIHLITRDNGQLIYSKFNGQTQTWEIPRFLSDSPSAIYMQITYAGNGNIIVVYDDNKQLNLLASNDYGETFTVSSQLSYSAPQINLQNARMETPAYLNSNFLPVLRQVSNQKDTIQGLVFHGVDLTEISVSQNNNNYIGNMYSNQILGSDQHDFINGLAEDDWLQGFGGGDTLIGGSGNDTLKGDDGNDWLMGAGDNDEGGNSQDILLGGEGQDTFVLGNSNDIFYADNQTQDFAYILDFEIERDFLQLKGGISDYTGTNQYGGAIIKIAETDEEIAFLKGIKIQELKISNIIFI